MSIAYTSHSSDAFLFWLSAYDGCFAPRGFIGELQKELPDHEAIRDSFRYSKKKPFFGTRASVVSLDRFERQFQANAPLSKLVTDITYIWVEERFVYLSAI